jgi:uncharacterized protein (TIGR03437 family)
MRKRQLSRFFPLPAVLLLTAFFPAAHAQTGTQTTVLANPAGPEFSVDGTVYFNAMSAFWPVGSVHTLSVPQGVGYSYDQTFDTQWQFQQWAWANGSSSSPTIQVIGNVGSDKFTAVFAVQYLFNTAVACNPAPCTEVPGTMMVNGSVATPGGIWVAAGSSEALLPVANPGWIFAGWQIGGTIVSTFQPYTATVNGPTTATATFIPAKPVTLATNPPNLTFYADGTLTNYNAYTGAPDVLEWGLGTSHTISGLDVTMDSNGKRWVFASWSDGGAQTHAYVVGKTFSPETLTCKYAAAAYPFFITSPYDLDLVVDGQVLPPPYSYIWGVGSTHTISATTPQTDSHGNTWLFQSWDDGVTTPSRTFAIPVGADVNGFRMTALYTQQAQLTVNSTIAGQVVTVDGSSCTTPCTLTKTAGIPVHASAPASVPVSSNSRQSLLGWSTGSGAPVAGDWAGTLTTAGTTITATYHLMNSLTVTADPSTGATWRLSPTSPDGFYDSATRVTIHVSPRPGYRFSRWSGDLSGSDPSGSLLMNVPHSATAMLTGAPTHSRGGLTVSAEGSISGVAPGSIASVFGQNLTAESASAPSNHLAKTLAGVTVRIGTRTLPLFFASPTQINFQIPADLSPGDSTLTVSSEGLPDVTSDFSIVRNAPALFPATGQAYAMAMHEDGTPVTPDAPARQGELLTAYGTGFGPTDRVRPEGVAVPASPRYMILDPVTIQVGSAVFKPESSFAAPGQVGVDMVQFRLDGTAPTGAAVAISLTVNGVESNSLTLPIQ